MYIVNGIYMYYILCVILGLFSLYIYICTHKTDVRKMMYCDSIISVFHLKR